MTGQAIFHLLAAAHAARAPWPVVLLVACLPVVTLGFGAALTHLLRAEPATVTPAAIGTVTEPDTTDRTFIEARPVTGHKPTAKHGRSPAADREAAALALLAGQPDITGGELARQLGVSPRTGQRYRDRLTSSVPAP